MRALIGRSVPGAGGAALCTDVYLPDLVPAPVLLTRTPYGRGGHRDEGRAWARRGFVFVAQDVRGRYDSPGTWRPYRGERGDGAALIRWVHEQPWCDGRVFTAGASYAAYTGWALAVTEPALVAGVISMVPAMGLHEVKFDPSGILRLAEHASWWAEHGDARVSRTGLAAAMFAAEPELLGHVPVAAIGEQMWPDLPGWWAAVADGPVPGPEAITDDELAALGLPALHIGGWHDLLAARTIAHWRLAGGALIVGPWGHQLGPCPGAAEDTRAAEPRSLGETQVDWVRSVLDGRPGKGMRVGVLGGSWPRWSEWPKTADVVLHADATGALRSGPPTEGRATFTSDPARPFPSRPPGTDRAGLADRADAVRFATSEVSGTILGEPMVTLHADTDAAGTDWVLRLLLRDLDGSVRSLSSGAVQATRGAGGVHTVTTTPVAAAVPAGARLELEVAGADFPDLARNPQTGADRYTATAFAAATQTVHCGPGGTRVTLPMLAEER